MEIPSEVLEEILVRLPVKKLLQLRCVSKSWFSIISSPSFISAVEYRNNNTSLDSPLLLRYYSCSKRKTRISLDINHGHPRSQQKAVQFPLDNNGCNFYDFVGSCNGLLCLSTSVETHVQMVLWNCSIRKYIHIPVPHVLSSNNLFSYILGFGSHYQDHKYDFKILRLVYFLRRDQSEKFLPVADIYYLSTNSWRPIQSSVMDTVNCVVDDLYGSPQAFLNEAIHWIGYSENKKKVKKRVILVFHIGNEVFSEMEVPESVDNGNGRLSLIVHDYSQTETWTPSLWLVEQDHQRLDVCYIWVMKEYGVVHSWIKQFSVDMCHHGGLLRVLGIRERGQGLILTLKEKLISYCTGSHSIKSLGIQGDEFSFSITPYKESLFLLNM